MTTYRLGIYSSFSLLGQHKATSIATFPIDELIKKIDSFIGVFVEYFNLKDKVKLDGWGNVMIHKYMHPIRRL